MPLISVETWQQRVSTGLKSASLYRSWFHKAETNAQALLINSQHEPGGAHGLFEMWGMGLGFPSWSAGLGFPSWGQGLKF